MIAWGSWKNRDLKFKKRFEKRLQGTQWAQTWFVISKWHLPAMLKQGQKGDAKATIIDLVDYQVSLVYENDCHLCHDLRKIPWRHLMSLVFFCCLMQHLWSTSLLVYNKLQCAHNHATCILGHTRSRVHISPFHWSISLGSLVNNGVSVNFVNCNLQSIPETFLDLCHIWCWITETLMFVRTVYKTVFYHSSTWNTFATTVQLTQMYITDNWQLNYIRMFAASPAG